MVTLKSDNKSRVRIPDIKPGQVFAFVANADGTFLLSPVKAIEHKPGILDGLKPIPAKDAEKLYKTPNPEFDELEHHCSRLPVRPPQD